MPHHRGDSVDADVVRCSARAYAPASVKGGGHRRFRSIDTRALASSNARKRVLRERGGMLLRAKFLVRSACVVWLGACGGDEAAATKVASSDMTEPTDRRTADPAGRSGNSGPGEAGRAGRRPPTACDPQETTEVTCGGELCPTSSKHERDPCFLPCCVQHEGKDRCGFRGTSRAFTTACVLPAVSDPSCDEVPQFEGCCEPTRHVCGVIGGFAPGCQTESPFLTFPDPLKACGGAAHDSDAGVD